MGGLPCRQKRLGPRPWDTGAGRWTGFGVGPLEGPKRIPPRGLGARLQVPRVRIAQGRPTRTELAPEQISATTVTADPPYLPAWHGGFGMEPSRRTYTHVTPPLEPSMPPRRAPSHEST